MEHLASLTPTRIGLSTVPTREDTRSIADMCVQKRATISLREFDGSGELITRETLGLNPGETFRLPTGVHTYRGTMRLAPDMLLFETSDGGVHRVSRSTVEAWFSDGAISRIDSESEETSGAVDGLIAALPLIGK